jgi:DNA-3-methyladenine glycosylase
MTILPASFYDRDPAVVAPLLLGKYLVRTYRGKKLVGMITETEAYLPFGDEASHGFKRTKTRDSLYLHAGHAYVYGLRHHFLFNTVTQDKDHPGAVLIRGVVPIEGIEVMKALREKDTRKGLTDGPGKLCKAFAITLRDDGIDLTKRTQGIYIEDRGEKIDPKTIRITPRIGITKAADWLLRFYIDV